MAKDTKKSTDKATVKAAAAAAVPVTAPKAAPKKIAKEAVKVEPKKVAKVTAKAAVKPKAKPATKAASHPEVKVAAPVATAAAASRMPIKIGISSKDRELISEGLSRLLADTYTLYLTTHNFHWNVTGPMFNTLHTMFMGQYTELWNAVDPVAERIRSLGHFAPGSYGQFGKLTSLPDVPATPPKATEMIRILVEGNEAVARTARELFPLADQANDEPTADLLTQRLTVHEQNAWMLRALLED